MQNTDGMADEAKELMKQMLNSITFDMMLISKGHKDPHWQRLCDLPFSTKVLYNYYNGYKLMSDTVVSNTDNKVKCLFCNEKVSSGRVFTNWDTKPRGKGGCWRQYRNHCSDKHEDLVWYHEVRLQLEFSKWEEITVPHILQCSLFDANKIAPISTQHAVSYLKDRDPIPLISCISKQFGHAHSHLTGRATRAYFEQVMQRLGQPDNLPDNLFNEPQIVEEYVNKKTRKPACRPKSFVQRAVQQMIEEAGRTLDEMGACFNACDFHWVESKCPMKLMNALNLFFRCGLLFDTTFPPIHDLDISKDTIYTIWEQESSLQEKTVKNESNNEGSSHEEGGIVESGQSIAL